MMTTWLGNVNRYVQDTRDLPICKMLIRKHAYIFMKSAAESRNVILHSIVRSDSLFTSPLWQHCMRRRSGRKCIEMAKWFESARWGTESALEGTESAREGTESAREGTESAREGIESAREGTESAREGTESALVSLR